MNLFEEKVGVFRGFRQGGLEFHADLVLPYRYDFSISPMHGQFLLIELGDNEEAVLGRIASFSSEGKLTSNTGEEFSIRASKSGEEIPENLRERYLKYEVNIRVLGVIRSEGEGYNFVPSHRRLPHAGASVSFPNKDVLRFLTSHFEDGENISDLGNLSFGEYVYYGKDNENEESWMQVMEDEVTLKFPVDSLISRRSFIFARAGFGKSNLNKLLFSKLYKTIPHVEKADGNLPVGTIIFDPDGEYFWPDDKGRPGLCDVEYLEDKIALFTNRSHSSKFYNKFVVSSPKINVSEITATQIISQVVEPEAQNQAGIRKLSNLKKDKWKKLINEAEKIINNGEQFKLYDMEESPVKIAFPEKNPNDAAFGGAARRIIDIVLNHHDPKSNLLDEIEKNLKNGKICIVDISLMQDKAALATIGIILNKIFNNNQKAFTDKRIKSIPTIAVLEEAQSVLNTNSGTNKPMINWVKEGRKYDLGTLLVTQQPGSISDEILSQGDNWFVFHLLSNRDLQVLKNANAHFSEDILSSLLNEPIPGNGVYWSSVPINGIAKPYPVSFRASNFEKANPVKNLNNIANLKKTSNDAGGDNSNKEIKPDFESKFLNKINGEYFFINKTKFDRKFDDGEKFNPDNKDHSNYISWILKNQEVGQSEKEIMEEFLDS